jgi:hypothetical protein
MVEQKELKKKHKQRTKELLRSILNKVEFIHAELQNKMRM